MTKRNPLPDAEYLRSLFTYEPDTGLLRWKVDRSNKRAGDQAGAKRGENGYLQVSINNHLYRVHLVIWKMATGGEPENHIDHEDTVKWNNRWDNLRDASKSQNQANVGLTKANTSGAKGASRYRQGDAWGKPWQAGIKKDGKHYHLGHFATKEDAAEAYRVKAIELFGAFARVA